MTREEMIEKLNGAHTAMTDAVARQWRGDVALKISIPARPDHDTDFLVCEPIRQVLAALSSAPPDLVSLRHAWEAGFRLCRNYGDNHHHWDGEQREHRWRGYLASVDAACDHSEQSTEPRPPTYPTGAILRCETPCPGCARGFCFRYPKAPAPPAVDPTDLVPEHVRQHSRAIVDMYRGLVPSDKISRGTLAAMAIGLLERWLAAAPAVEGYYEMPCAVCCLPAVSSRSLHTLTGPPAAIVHDKCIGRDVAPPLASGSAPRQGKGIAHVQRPTEA